MEQLIGLTDTIYLGHVGEVELGASAIAGIFYLTIFMVGFGFSIGAQVLIARRNGEGNLAGIGPISGCRDFDRCRDEIDDIPTLYSIDVVNMDTCANELLMEDIRKYGRKIL